MRKLINAPDKCLLNKELDCDYDKIFIDGDSCDETTCQRLRRYLETLNDEWQRFTDNWQDFEGGDI